MTTSVHDFFNKTDNYLHKRFSVRVRCDIVKDLIGEPKGTLILDAGCGDGGVTLPFVKNNAVTFLDLSENMLALVKKSIPKEHRKNANYVHNSIENLHEVQKYDYVVAMGLLAHVPSLPLAVKQLSDLVAPQGAILLQFSNYGSWLTRLRIWLSRHRQHTVNVIRYADIENLVRDNGLEVTEERKFAFLLPGMGYLPDHWLYRYSTFLRKNKLFSKLGTDYIWMLRRRSAC